jgi:nucleotide-binding universal stress UspA family protein
VSYKDLLVVLDSEGDCAQTHRLWEVLLSRAADLGVDLIAMGAYGHSRMREMLLSGATRSVLRSMTVPVLMSH